MTPEDFDQIKRNLGWGFYTDAGVLDRLIAEVERLRAENERLTAELAELRIAERSRDNVAT